MADVDQVTIAPGVAMPLGLGIAAGLRPAGLARSVGVSIFAETHLARVAAATRVGPAANQIEPHPFLQRALRAGHGIVTQAWSPIGQGKGLLAGPGPDPATFG